MTKVWVPVAYGSALVSYNFAQLAGWSFERCARRARSSRLPGGKMRAHRARVCPRRYLSWLELHARCARPLSPPATPGKAKPSIAQQFAVRYSVCTQGYRGRIAREATAKLLPATYGRVLRCEWATYISVISYQNR